MIGLIVTSILLALPDSWIIAVAGCKMPGLLKLSIFILFIISIITIIFDIISCYNKKRKNDKASCQSQTETIPPEAIEVLRVIAAMLSPFGNNRQEATIDKIALSETFRMSHQQTERLFELLEKAGTLETNDIGIYGITGEGRKLLNEKEKMP